MNNFPLTVPEASVKLAVMKNGVKMLIVIAS